jgi:hypothetical protein
VIQPQAGLGAFLARNVIWVVLGAVLIAGLILTLVLAVGGRRRQRAARKPRRQNLDPVTQPIFRTEAGRSARRSRRPKPAPACLVRLKADGQPVSAPPIPLTEAELTFGNDPTKAARLIDDPSVSGLHATLIRDEDDGFSLRDEKSVAGTWVNYEPVGGEPRRLQHGDVIYFGQVSYRFMLSRPPERPAPRLTREQP